MPTSNTIRLATFNILHGAGAADGVVDLDRFAAAVASLDTDILALQEVDHGQARSGGAALADLAAEAMGASDFRFFPVLPGYGIALVSRFAGHDWSTLRLPRWPTRYPVPRLRQRRVILLGDEPRGALSARFDTPSGPLTVGCAHLSYLPGVRERQISLVTRRLRTADHPFVILGDFNLRAPWPARLSRLQPLAAHLTFPADRPTRQIDHALAGRGVEAIRSRAVQTPISDHQALVVDIRLSPRA